MQKCPVCGEQVLEEGACKRCATRQAVKALGIEGIQISEALPPSEPEPPPKRRGFRIPRWVNLLVIVCSVCVILKNQPPKQVETSAPSVVHTTRPAIRGDETTINAQAFGAVDDQAEAELESVLRSGDGERLGRLEAEGRVRRLLKGTKVVIVEAGFSSTTVRICSGSFNGEESLVANRFLDEIP